MLYAIVGILVIILDQGVKFWVTQNLMVDVITEPLIPGVLSLVRLHNDGAAFSFLAGGGARIYFIILTAVFTIAVIIALVTNFINGSFGRWCLVLVTAGGLSNCLDRVLYGYVVDMFKVDLFDFAVFNVADIFITVFSLLFIIYIIFGGEGKKTDEPDEFDEDDDEDADQAPVSGSFKKAREAQKAERSAKAIKAARERGADGRSRKYAEDDDDDVDSPRFGFKRARAEEPAPAKRPAEGAKASRAQKPLEGFGQTKQQSAARGTKPKKTLYEEDYEQYKAAHPEVKQGARKAAAAKPQTLAFDPSDPFAEWERANARVESRQNSSYTAKAMGVAQSETTQEQPRKKTPIITESTREDIPAAAPAAAPAAKPAASSASAARPAAPAAKPAASSASAVRPAAPAAKPQTPAAKPSSDADFSLDDILNEFK